MASSDLSFNILTKYQDRGVKQAGKDFDGLRTKTVAVGTFIGQAMFGATKAVARFAKDGLGSAISEAREAEKVGRITANVIRATGGAAKISSAQVGALAESLSNKTAIDDELVQSGANLLLTFKNIRNEAGKGNDIFNQATAAALDLSAAGFGSVESASKMLGKALNDPLKGITALSRAGVTFTDQQKKQIKTLVESGNVLGAQRIIMKEIASQVGGAAKAAADPMQRLGVIAANMKERIGTALLPIIGKVAEWLGKKLPKALDVALLGFRALGAAFREGDVTSDGFVGAMEKIGVVLRVAWMGIKALVAAFKEGDVTSDGFVGVMERIGVSARKIADFFRTQIVPAVVGFVREMRDGTGAGGAFAGVLTSIVKAGAATIGFFAKHTTLLKTLAVAIGAVVVMTKLHTAAMAVQAAGGMVAFLTNYLKGIKLVQVATKVWTAFQWLLNIALNANPISLIILAIAGLVAGLVIAYKKSETFRKIVDGAFRAVKVAAQFAWDWIKKNWPLLLAVITGPIGLAVLAVVKNWDRIKSTAQAAFRFVVVKFLDLVSALITGAARAFGWVPGLGPKLKAAAAKFAEFRNSVNAALGGIKSRRIEVIAGVRVGGGRSSGGGRTTSGGITRAGGGILPGAPSDRDNMLIHAASGEFVVNARQAAKHRALLEAVNAGRVPGFAAGGLVVGARTGGIKQATDAIVARIQAWAQRNWMSLFDTNAGFRGGAGVERWRGVALQALGLAGSPLSWIGSLLRRMNQESGGNPRAINLWDVNARRGTPSIGLMQTIGPTFNAYAGALRGRGIYDPLANIYASIRYANARYGSAPRGWNRAGGYDQGGFLPPGLSLAYNGTGRPERVLPPGRGGGDGATVVINVSGSVYDVQRFKAEVATAVREGLRTGHIRIA